MSLRTSADEAVIILSEPPSTVPPASLAALVRATFGDDLLELRTLRWPIGIDGWLGDLVLRVRRHGTEKTPVYAGDTMARWSAPADVVDRLQLLHRFLYQTNDGFWIDNLNNISVPQTAVPDLTISVAALNGWTKGETSPWISLANPNGRAVWKDVTSASTAAAYRRGNELVALVLPNGEPLRNAQAAFRRFAVASDVLAGAVKSENGNLVVLGRARTVPLAVLPPLRFETFANFADHRSSQLEQSYERNAVFAGRVFSGEYASWDWAPILLSAQLDDTEAGAILNLSDQVLKSWSEHGYLEYYAFYHPKPDTFPFGALRASDHFGSKMSLRYNWNTEKFSSTVELPGETIFAPNRTDALPVLYDPTVSRGDPGSAVIKASNVDVTADARRQAVMARDYFARLGDPLLVRDVQNVILYQIAQHFLSTPDTSTVDGRSGRVADVLGTETRRVIHRVTSAGPPGDDPTLKQDTLGLMKATKLDEGSFANFVASPQHFFNEKVDRAKKASRASLAVFETACEEVSGELTEGRCRHSEPWSDATKERIDRAAAEADRAFDELRALKAEAPKISALTRRITDQGDNRPVLQHILSQSATMATTGFVRTPSVVLSRDTADRTAVGGHNIYAETEHLAASAVKVKVPPIAATLKTKGRGTLLDEMRALPQPSDLTEMLARAKTCDCDALITQTPTGEISIVRNAGGPPAVTSVVRGKSGVLEAIAPPPRLGVVRFDGFPPKTVEDILTTKALIEGPPRGSGLLKQVRKLFSPSRGKRETTIEVLVDRPGVPIELTGKAAISPRFTWSGEPSALVDAHDFNRLLGLPASAESDGATLQVVVKFNDSPGRHADVLGVRARGQGAHAADAGQRFKTIVDTWLGRQPKNVHVLEAANELDKTIRAAMPSLQQELYLGKNTHSLRVANRDGGTAAPPPLVAAAW